MSEQVELSSQSLLDIEYEEEDLDFTETSAQEQHARKRPRVWLVVVIILLVIVLVLGGLFYWLAHRTPSVRYTQAYVTTGTIAQQISATGPIKAKAEYDMNFTSSGQVKTIDVKVGDQVKAGQQLATITPTNAQQNNNSSVTTLTAPADATVAALNGYVGMSTGSGSGSASGSGGSSTGAFIVLTDTSALQITAQVNESDIGNVKVGQSAQFTVPAYPNATLKATVATIETIGQSNSGVVTYPVDLTVDMTSLSNVHLLPAMTATVNITTAQQTNALRVPAAALTFETTALQQGLISRTNLVQALRGSGGQGGFGQGNNSNTTGGTTNQGSGQHGVVLELQNGQLTPVLVTTGLSNGQFTQILSGLNEGDQVVTGATGGSIQSTTGGATGAQGGFGGAGGFGGGFGGGGGRFGGGGNGGGGRSGGGGNAGGGAGGQ